MDKYAYEGELIVLKEIKFPIEYRVVGDKICFYSMGIRFSLTLVTSYFDLKLYEVYKEYNMRYHYNFYYEVSEEDADRFVRYINSMALLKKV